MTQTPKWRSRVVGAALVAFSMTVISVFPGDIRAQESEPASKQQDPDDAEKERLQMELNDSKQANNDLKRMLDEAKQMLAEQEKIQEELQGKQQREQERIKLAEQTFNGLEENFKEKFAEFRKRSRQVRSRAEYNEVQRSNPASDFAKQMFELAEDYADTPTAKRALNAAIKQGSGSGKNSAMRRLLEMAEMDKTSERATEIFELLMQSGSGQPQRKAMQNLMELAEKEPTTDRSINILKRIASMRGRMPGKQKALELLFEQAQTDARSNRSADHFVLIAREANGEMKGEALNQLMEHHRDNGNLMTVMKSLPRSTPSQATEDWLKQMCKKSSGAVQANAIITFAQYVSRRNMYRNVVSNNPEQAEQALGKEAVEYLSRELDPEESKMIEGWLEQYISDNESLLESAKKELFVMQNLSIGCTAPDIVATDLDGVEFKLSDYRGKIVFLDFWGDW